MSSATPLYPSYHSSSLPVTQPIFHIIHLATLPSLRFAVLCLVTQSCLTLCNPMDCSQAPLSMGILQARILEWDPPGDLPNPGIKPKSRGLLFRCYWWRGEKIMERKPPYPSKPTNSVHLALCAQHSSNCGREHNTDLALRRLRTTKTTTNIYYLLCVSTDLRFLHTQRHFILSTTI